MTGKGKLITICILLAAILAMVGLILFTPGKQEASAEQAETALLFSETRTVPPEIPVQTVYTTSAAPTAPAPAIESTPSPSPAPSPSPSPSSTPDPTPENAKKDSAQPLKGLVIGVDPGHQGKSNNGQEPVSPGSGETKKKVSSGTQGIHTRIAEHVVNLNVGLRLKKLLEDAGATVVMTRTGADVDISNAERAQLFNSKEVDLGIRIHCNGSADESVTGAFMLVPADKEYPYYDENIEAAKAILAAYGKATGIGVKRGITYRSDQTGFNWCERPIVNIEMGHMTNKEEDLKLTDEDFQKKMAQGILDGIVGYFSRGA